MILLQKLRILFPVSQNNKKNHTRRKRDVAHMVYIRRDIRRDIRLASHQAAGNARHEETLGQVHRIGNRHDDQFRLASRRPIKDVVHYGLLPRPQ